MVDRPWMWIIGGPNGAGKTTLARAVLGDTLPAHVFINTDEIAKTLEGGAASSPLRAGRLSIEAVTAQIAKRKSFAVETTLSSRRYLNLIGDLVGWRLGLFYVGVANSEISLSRVARRVASGGHDVPADDVRRRFRRSATLLREHAVCCDRVLVFDNSQTQPYLVVEGWRDEVNWDNISFPWDGWRSVDE